MVPKSNAPAQLTQSEYSPKFDQVSPVFSKYEEAKSALEPKGKMNSFSDQDSEEQRLPEEKKIGMQ